jgi:hypothetical protein
VLRDALKDICVEEHAPNIEQLHKRSSLIIRLSVLKGYRENLSHVLLEYVDVVPLDIFQYAV